MRCSSCAHEWPLWPMLRHFPERATATCPCCGELSPWVGRIKRIRTILLVSPATLVQPQSLWPFAVLAAGLLATVHDDWIDRKLAAPRRRKLEALDYRSGSELPPGRAR